MIKIVLPDGYSLEQTESGWYSFGRSSTIDDALDALVAEVERLREVPAAFQQFLGVDDLKINKRSIDEFVHEDALVQIIHGDKDG